MPSFRRVYLTLVLLAFCASSAHAATADCPLLVKKLGTLILRQGKADKTDPLRTARLLDKSTADAVDALYFIDYEHSAGTLLSAAQTKNPKLLAEIPHLYDADGAKAFANFQQAKLQLSQERDPLSVSALLRTHETCMKDGVEEITKAEVGKFRNHHAFGEQWRDYSITNEQMATVRKNPYLDFEIKGQKAERTWGYVIYPDPETIKSTALARIKNSDPDIFERVSTYKRLLKSGKPIPKELSLETLTPSLLEALVKERLTTFKAELKKLGLPAGQVQTPEQLKRYTRLVGEFSRDMVSIHPFAEGNGRVTRLFALYEPVTRAGLPPPRLFDTSSDYLSPLESWVEQIHTGIDSSKRLHADLVERARLGLPIENSPELLTPMIPRKAPAVIEEYPLNRLTSAETDPRQFQSFVLTSLSKDSRLAAKYKTDPVSTMHKIQEDYQKFIGSRVVEGRPGMPYSEEGLNFVDPDFEFLFGKSMAHAPELWQLKRDLWYHDDVVWRGMVDFETKAKDADLVKMFYEPSTHMASNAVVAKAWTPAEIAKAAKQDFADYNRALMDGSLEHMAADHANVGPLYNKSYGYSTSTGTEQAKQFAMGFNGENLQGYLTEEFQKTVKSRVMVGAYQAKKDVDLPSLHKFRPEYKNTYDMESEVLGIGAADPDSVMVVKVFDSGGYIEKTFIRDPNHPETIYLVRGNMNVRNQMPPPAEFLIKTFVTPVPKKSPNGQESFADYVKRLKVK